jgi:stage II sporulation protein P
MSMGVLRPVLLLALLLMLTAPTVAAAAPGAITRVVSTDGELLFATGLSVHPGDRFIDSSNDVWSVTSRDRDRAIARRIARLVRPPGRRELSLLGSAMPRAAHAVTGAPLTDVAIYHTHGGDGTVFQAGAALAGALSARGLRVIHRPDSHGPQGDGAYLSSRRTAQELLETVTPVALFDIQRDAVPSGAILIVVGRSNPASDANLAFARLVKGRADELTPGLIKGIFLGQGTFNQDLTARSLLFLVGASGGEAGAAQLAVSLPAVLRDLEGPGGAPAEAAALTWRSAGSLLLAFTLLAGLWMLVVHGGWRPAVERLLGHSRERR